MKTLLLSLLGVLMLVGLPAAGYASPPLLGHWAFDEGSGTIAHDKSPNHYHGTLSSGGASWAAGIAGGAISLVAANGGLVDMGPVLNNLAGTSYTIAAWVKTSIVGESNQIVVASHNAHLAAGYILGVNTSGGVYGQPGKAWFYNLGPGLVSPYSSLTVVDGAWHHLVGVRDAAKGIVSLYVDGIFQRSYADQGLGNTPGTPLLFGAVMDYELVYYRYTGLIDDVQIYGAALSDRDIQFLFKNPGRTLLISSPGVNFLLLGAD
jgi:hypothetical protein